MLSPGSWTLSLARLVCSSSVFVWHKGFPSGNPFILQLYGHAKCKCIGPIWSFLFFKSYTWLLPADLRALRGGLSLSYPTHWQLHLVNLSENWSSWTIPTEILFLQCFLFFLKNSVSKNFLGRRQELHTWGNQDPCFCQWQAQSLLWLNGDSLDWKLLLWGRQSRKCCGGSWSPSQYLNTEHNRQKAPLSGSVFLKTLQLA